MTWTRQQTWLGTEAAIVWVFANSLIRFSVFFHDGTWQAHWGRKHVALKAEDETEARLEGLRFVSEHLKSARETVNQEGLAMTEAAKADLKADTAPVDRFEEWFKPDHSRTCAVYKCGAHPIVPLTKKCGPCTFRDSSYADGAWYQILKARRELRGRAELAPAGSAKQASPRPPSEPQSPPQRSPEPAPESKASSPRGRGTSPKSPP